MPSATISKDDLLNQALELIALIGWRNFSPLDLARKSSLPLSDVYAYFPDKSDILTALMERTDRYVLSQITEDTLKESHKDRLFDLLMNRFEVLTSHKKALRSVWDGAFSDPASLLKTAPNALRSARWMLEGAGYDTNGCFGFFKINSLALLYASVFSDWLRDDAPDQSKTMVSLDRLMSKLENIMNG